MNWVSLGLAALCGALAGVMAGAVTGDPKENRGRYAVTFMLIFGVLFGLCRVLVLPRYQVWHAMREAESELQKIPALVAIKKYEPQTYNELMAEMRQSAKDGVNPARVIATFHGRVQQIVLKRMPIASDEAVTEYMSVTMSELDEVYRQGGDLCYRFLFPQPGEVLDARQYFSKEVQQADLAGLAKVIESSARDAQRVPEEFEVSGKLQPIVQELANEYGDELRLMQSRSLIGNDRRKVCAMTAALYQKILRLPPKDSGRVLRYLVGKS